MIAAIGQSLGLDRAGIAHGARLALAAWLAFAIASLLHVGNAYWAAMPVWVVAQSSKGLLLERGFFRIVGTVLGAAVGFGMLQLVANPFVLLVLLGVWVAINAAATKVLRGLLGYATLMGGMTAAIVILPSVLSPEHSWAVGLARVECTLIGVVVVTLVTGLWTPDSPREDFYRGVRQLAGNAVAFAATVLQDLPPAQGDALEQRLLLEMGDTQASASRVTAGSVEGYRRLHHMDALIVASLTVMAAGRAVARRLRRDATPPGTLAADLRRLAEGLLVEPPPSEADLLVLLARIAGIAPRLAAALERLIAARAALRTEPGGADAHSFGRKATYLAPHHDARQAIEIGVAIGAATCLAAILGLVSGWSAGELAALGVCIFSMVLGSLPVPRMVAPLMLKGTAAGVGVALLYRLTIQPHIATLPALVLSVAPFILIGGLARASRKTAGPALDANMGFLLASQAVLPAVTDHAAIFNQAAALLLAALLVCPVVILTPQRPGRRVERIVQAICQDLLRLTTQVAPIDAAELEARSGRQILRLSLHLGQMASLPIPAGWSLLAVLSLGEAITRLEAFAADTEIDDRVRQELAASLLDLRRLREDPAGLAGDLEQRAQRLNDALGTAALLDVATSLRASHQLLTMAVVLAVPGVKPAAG